MLCFYRSFSTDDGEAEPTSHPKVPFEHYVVGISKDAKASDVFQQYQKALSKTKESFKGKEEKEAYNVVLVRDWVVLVSRTSKGRDDAPTNAAGMLGMVWVRSDEERQKWTDLGLSTYLALLGIPRAVA